MSSISVLALMTALSLLTDVVLAAFPRAPRSQNAASRSLRIKEAKEVGATLEQMQSGKPHVQLWAVIIGISNFKYGDQDIDGHVIRNLKYADEDAQAIHDFLRSPEGGGFRDREEGGHMILLKNEQATKANVEAALGSLKQAKPDDFFVVFIAAHGANVPIRPPGSDVVKKEPLFMLYDADPRDWQHTTLPMAAFTQLPRTTSAMKGLILTDTCSSAGVQLAGRGLNVSLEANEAYIDEMKRVEAGVGFIYASGQLEESLESDELRHGYFTYCLLEGLLGEADTVDLSGNPGQDGRVTFNELARYVSEQVPLITEGKQHPGHNTSAVEANYLALSVVPYTDADEETSGQYGTLIIRTPDVDGVEVAIDDYSVGKMDSRTQQSVRVRAGARNLTFSRNGKKISRQAMVPARRSVSVEVNLSFSQGDDDEDSAAQSPRRVNIYLTEDKVPNEEAKKLFQSGVESFNMQRFEAAIDLFRRAAEAGGNAFSQAFVYKGRAEQSLRRNQAAIESFQRALALKPSDYEAHTLLEEARFQNGDNIDEVARELKDIISGHPDFEVARVVYADVLNLKGNFRGAEQQLNHAIKIRDRYPPAHMILADTLTFMGSKARQRKAVQEAERAVQLFDDISRKQVSFARGLGYLSLTHVIFGGGRYLDKPAMAESRYVLAKALIVMVELDDSLDDPSAYLDRANSNISEARKLAEGFSDKSRLVQLLELSARIHFYKGEGQTAIKEAERSLKIAEALPGLKDYPEAHYTLSRAYENAQNCGEAEKHLRKYREVLGSLLSPREQQQVDDRLIRLENCKKANRQKR